MDITGILIAVVTLLTNTGQTRPTVVTVDAAATATVSQG